MRIDQLHKFQNIRTKRDLQLETKELVQGYNPYRLEGGEEDLIGLEVEVEGVLVDPHLKWLKCWISSNDPSLKDNGKEYQSWPLYPEFVMDALCALKMGLQESSPDHYFRWRSAFHYHLNVRDLTLEQLAVFLLLYSTVEFLMFKMTTEFRMASNFCVPVNDTYDYYEFVRELLEGKWDRGDFQPDMAGGKYGALGLFRLWDLGTVEFRHLHGTLDLHLLQNWIGLGLALKKAARNISAKKLERILCTLNTTSRYANYIQMLGIDMDGHIPIEAVSIPISNAKQCFVKPLVVKENNLWHSPLGRKVLRKEAI
jgi:hypothetical protein